MKKISELGSTRDYHLILTHLPNPACWIIHISSLEHALSQDSPCSFKYTHKYITPTQVFVFRTDYFTYYISLSVTCLFMFHFK